MTFEPEADAVRRARLPGPLLPLLIALGGLLAAGAIAWLSK